jgi:hypothetical protein
LLTGEWAELENYMNDVSKRILEKASEDEWRYKTENIHLRRLNFWYKNYEKFLDEGL